MRIFNRETSKKTVLTLACISVFIFMSGLGIGYLVFGGSEAAELPGDTDNVANMGPKSVLPETNVIFEYNFLECGHTITRSPTASLTGMTEDEIRKMYPGYTILQFAKENLLMQCKIEGHCPDHYLLKLEEGRLYVYRTDEVTLKPGQLMNLSIDVTSVDETAVEALSKGIAFSSLSDIDIYLENLDS
jgi:hypothetical protein